MKAIKRMLSVVLAAGLVLECFSDISVRVYAAETESVIADPVVSGEAEDFPDAETSLDDKDFLEETGKEESFPDEIDGESDTGEESEKGSESDAGEKLKEDEEELNAGEEQEKDGEESDIGKELEEGMEESDAGDEPEEGGEDSDVEEDIQQTEVLETESLTVEAGTVYSTPSTGNFANVVLFVDFADTDHTSHQYCLKDVEKTLDLFNGSESSPCGMRQYISNISYGQLTVDNIFPQYDGEKIVPYTLSGNAESYNGDSLDTDFSIIKEALQKLNADNTISMADVDRNHDGNVDNLTIILACGSKAIRDRFYGRKASYLDSGKINGCNVKDYIRVPEYGMYSPVESSGLLIHEFLHTVGYPDLYSSSGVTVGWWDIMSAVSAGVTYPLAYLRSQYTKWFDIPMVTQNCSDYHLYAASTATWETRDRQAVMLRTAYSDTEFFVLEFRKKGTDINSKNYDYTVHGSGLIIYRVNTSERASTAEDTPLKIYTFRPGDQYNSYGREAGKGDIFLSFLSKESGRTSYGSPDAGATLSEGALTYSDGTNSGIVISNVGSAEGEQISFDITFHDVSSNGGFWNPVTVQEAPSLYGLDSCMGQDGTIYYLQKTMPPDNKIYLYQYAGSEWRLLGTPQYSSGFDYHLVKYQDSLYVAYNTGSCVQLLRWNESKGWNTVYSSQTGANEIAVTSDTQGIYLAYASTDNSRLYTCRYTLSGMTDMGIAAESGASIWNPVITAENGKIVVMYREVRADNRWTVKQYDSSWKTVGDFSSKSTAGTMKLYKGKIYLLTGHESDSDGGYLYLYDLSSAKNSWIRVADQPYASGNIMNLQVCFHGDAPHVICQDGKTEQVNVYSLVDGKWEALGNRVVSESVLGLKAYSWNGKIYLTYRNDGDGYIYIKSHFSQNTGGVPGSDSESSDGENQGGNTGGSTGNGTGENGTGSNTGGSTGSGSNYVPKSGWNLINGKWYYYVGGRMQTGWLKLGDMWYYLSGSGAMQTGWLKLGNTWYYLSGSGAMQTGWLKLGNTWYYLSGSGAMQTGWLKLGNTWYYLSGSGAMVKADTLINGVVNRFDSSGAWLGIKS